TAETDDALKDEVADQPGHGIHHHDRPAREAECFRTESWSEVAFGGFAGSMVNPVHDAIAIPIAHEDNGEDRFEQAAQSGGVRPADRIREKQSVSPTTGKHCEERPEEVGKHCGDPNRV